MMVRSRGFSLLEVMLALVVIALGIGVLLTFSTSSQRETASKAIGNDYSIVINDILTSFVDALNNCNDSTSTSCTLKNDSTEWTAYNYLCGNTSNTTIPDNKNANCTNGKISYDQYIALKNKGIDLTAITVVSVSAKRSDTH